MEWSVPSGVVPSPPLVDLAPPAGLEAQPQPDTGAPIVIVLPPTSSAATDPAGSSGAVPSAQASSADRAPPGEIVITGRKEAAGDPLREINAQSFEVTQKIDDAVMGPAAKTYKETVPSPIRKGIHNFLYNLREPIVFLNYLLQFKPGKAAETVGRFGINSTIGLAGFMDVAKRKPFHLPRRSNGFANTLGYYGVKNGPFLFLPVVGPTTVRDLLGGALDRLVLPVGVGSPFTSLTYSVPAGVLGALDHRTEFDRTLKDLHDNSPDPYAATRAFYLNRRQAEIDQLHGRGNGDPAGMSGAPSSVRPFIPKDLEPEAKPSSSPAVPSAEP
ncbi:MAG: VacJ family lipoprotein, partial [Acetobacteraceae bacterium]